MVFHDEKEWIFRIISFYKGFDTKKARQPLDPDSLFHDSSEGKQHYLTSRTDGRRIPRKVAYDVSFTVR
jgi:hypothetical protein